MLFSSFLCLLYLMVLVDSHTISKSIINKDKEIDDLYDSLNDYESTKNRIYPHEKFLHKHRRSKIEDTTKPVIRQQRTKEVTQHVFKTTKTDAPKLHLKPVHESTERKIGGFWRKFKIKGRHEDLGREKRLRQYLSKLPMSQAIKTVDDYPKLALLELNNNKRVIKLKKRRDALTKSYNENTIVSKVPNNEKTYLTKDDSNITLNKKITISTTPSNRPYKSEAEDLKKIISSITTKLTELDNTYNLNNIFIKNTSPRVLNYGKYISTNQETSSTLEEMELIGTAQIEALLNNIKEKAIEMIAEQHPLITDIITNTVTEATFEADPILNHIQIVSPEYALSTFFSIKNISDDKLTENSTEPYKEEITKRYTHDIDARSIKEEAMSVAQNVEEKLQKEFKSIYKKVKNKVSCDLKKEMHDVKSTMKQKIDSTLKKTRTDICNKTKKNTLVTKCISNTNKHSVTKSSVPNIKDEYPIQDDTTTKEAYIQTTVDDYAMLTLFEQMLAKTQDNNVVRTLTTTEKLARKKRKENSHNTEQGTVSLLDQETKKIVNNKYDDSEYQLPEIYDYSISVTMPDITTTMPESNDIEDEKITNVYSERSEENEQARNKLNKEGIKSSSDEYRSQFSEETQSTDSFEDTSLEHLSNKISYNEYVNGYKHYLNFQKEQANQNFSNLVKYQAHRHHNVDDIGKYILNKIPQLPQPPSRDKRFFDDYDIDDQDISTKGDDSWFKKHFYMFVDNGPPKKFHTSQTISLKSAMSGTSKETTTADTDSSRKKNNSNYSESRKEMEINLDDLTKNLLNEKTSIGLLPSRDHVTSSDTTQVPQNGNLMDITPELKEFRPYFISKLFGKARRTLKPEKKLFDDKTEHSSPLLKIINKIKESDRDFLWENDKSRFRRNSRKVTTNILIQKENLRTVKPSSTDKKHGNVDVNIIPGTALNKPEKLSPKVDLIKELINLFSFGKHKNVTSKRAKRDNRVQRFNPLKKIKDYFKTKPEEKLFKTNLNIPDYEMMKSHLDTFKPIKYNKILTVDEMKKQIPNITDDSEIVSLLVNNIENKKHLYRPIKKPVEGKLTKEQFEAMKNFRTYTTKINAPQEKLYQNAYTDADDVFKINLKTLATIGNHGDSILASTTYMIIDDIRNDNIRDKVSSKKHDFNLLVNVPKTLSNDLELKPKKSQFNHYQSLTRSTKSLDVSKPMDTNHLLENNNIGRDAKVYYNTNEYARQEEVTQKASTTRESKISDISNTKRVQYNDFYDILMWHKDILQSDKIPTPWQDILKDIEPRDEYTPPNLEDLHKELIDVTDSLKQYKVIESPVHSLKTKLKTVSKGQNRRAENNMDDLKEVATGNKDVIIQEETFRINKKNKNSNKIEGFDHVVNKFKDLTQEKNVDLFNEDKKNNADQSLIYLDTTLLAYDDDVNYITKNLTPRKLSRNSLKTPDHKHKAESAQAVTKINQQPQQYFSTPLPMSTNDFERFLKENSLDVASVTSPLISLPTVPAVYVSSLKSNSRFTSQKKMNNNDLSYTKSTILKTNKAVKTETIDDFDMNNDEFDYLDELQNELYNNHYDGKDRFKRYNDDLINDGNSNTESNLSEIEKKINVYKNKFTLNPVVGVNEYINNNHHPQKDVKVTAINFDDLDKNIEDNKKTNLLNYHVNMDLRNPDKYTIITKSQTTVPVPFTSKSFRDTVSPSIHMENLDRPTKDEEFFNKIHNNLLYTKKSTVKTFPANSGGNIGNTVPLPVDVFKEIPFKNGNQPKRVKISGQSYKYDIIYHHPEKKEHGFSEIPNLETSRENGVISTENWKRPLFNTNYKFKTFANVLITASGFNKVIDDTCTSDKTHPTKIRVDLPTYYLPDTKVTDTVTEAMRTWNERLFNYIPNLRALTPGYTSSSDPDAGAITEEYKQQRFIQNENNVKTIFEEDNEVYNRQNNSKPIAEDVPSVYREYGVIKSSKGKQNVKISTNTKKNALVKRDLGSQNIYTAKDVAALEVIVDLLKNTLKTEEKDDRNTKPDTYEGNRVTNSLANSGKPVTVPNSIQLHIAIPYENNDKKRSLAPVRVRKVFSARLSSPVDLEYQVHSFEATPATVITTTNDGLSPGIYLVVDDSKVPKAIALKPIKSKLTSFYRREAKTKINSEKIVTKNPTKGHVKVTLSKDLLSLISKHLANSSDNTELPNIKNSNRSKRGFNWVNIKKYFESDRACNCKCKANQTMCRACAASDAVINELIFEFDNLAKYMNEHCTEIQTYFRMNPSGGKKLRDSVHKIDQSLKDYFKRVKGKCQGRTCKTFATYMDKKRESPKQNGVEKNVGFNFINSLETIAENTEKVSKLVPCLNTKLRQKRDELIGTINNCENYDKRATARKENQVMKNVYSLDNVNVNIICNSDSTTISENNENNYINPDLVTRNYWNYDNNAKTTIKQGKFKKLFSCGRKSKIDKNITTKKRMPKDKREVTEAQIEYPLIADTGGSFWYDYINKRSTELKIKNTDEPDVKISVIQTQNLDNSTNWEQNNHFESALTTNNQGTNIPTIWDKNDDVFKILDHFKITENATHEITEKNIVKHNNSTTTTKKSKNSKKIQDKIKSYIKTTKKTNRNIKSKIKLHPRDKVKKVSKTTTLSTKTPEVTDTTNPSNSALEIITFTINDDKFDKDNTPDKEISSYGAIDNKSNESNTETTNNKAIDSKSTLIVFNGHNKHVTSEATTETNPTILILSDSSNEPEKYKSLLLSIIEHETNKLNNEWLKYAFVSDVVDSVTEEIRHFKRTERKTTKKDVTKDYASKIVPASAVEVSKSGDGLLKKIIGKLSKKVRGETKDKVVKGINADEMKLLLVNQKLKQNEQTNAYKKVYDSSRMPQHLCDLKATSKHIYRMYKRLKRTNFEIYTRNITCYKYRNAPRNIFINDNKNRTLNRVKKWNLERRKRIKRYESDKKNDRNFEKHNLKIDAEQFRIEDTGGFETFHKGDDNIYRCYKRKRRNADENDIARKLRSLPQIPSDLKKINVIDGDTVTLDCFGSNLPVTEASQGTWKAEREDMLDQDNVMVDATRITIRDVKAKNGGGYKCSESTGLEENFIVSVFALPIFNVIHTVVYTTDSGCTRQDLKMLQLMGSKLSEVACFGECTGFTQRPTCLRDNSDDNNAYAEVEVTLTPNPGPRVECSVQCRRDIQAALASLLMDNVLTIGSAPVVLHYNGMDKLLTPSLKQTDDSNTSAFSKIGVNLENKIDSDVSIGTRIVLSCPAGYRLLEDLIVCAACPVNAYAHEGDNKRFADPHGSRSEASTDKCRRLERRRTCLSDWWWYPPCGYCVAFGVVLCCCGLCVAFAFIIHVTSRGCRPRDSEKPRTKRYRKETLAHAHRHPQSPSRVILSKFFKMSLTPSLATDSQERKFEQWKERNVPPPLPPVDFDIFDSQTSKLSVPDAPNLR